MNRSTCNTCKKLVPATPTEREGQIVLVKACPECGTSETLISGDAARYQAKRRLDSGFEHRGCTLKCLTCTHKQPNIVFVDITNRCNLNCPICINNTPSMGFLFEPPLDYFRRIFQHFSTYASPPSIQLFGGEPTVRADLFDIIRLAKSFGFANALREVEQRLARTAPPVVAGPAAPGGKLTFREKLLKLRAIIAVARVFRRHGRIGRLVKGKGLGKLCHFLALAGGLALGRRTREVLQRHAQAQTFLQIITLPFEDRFTLETDRLERCPSAFAFWDPAEDRVKHVPVCAWGIHKTAVMRQIMDHYERKPAAERAVPVGGF